MTPDLFKATFDMYSHEGDITTEISFNGHVPNQPTPEQQRYFSEIKKTLRSTARREKVKFSVLYNDFARGACARINGEHCAPVTGKTRTAVVRAAVYRFGFDMYRK